MSSHLRGGGHIGSGVNSVGVSIGVGVTLSAQYSYQIFMDVQLGLSKELI